MATRTYRYRINPSGGKQTRAAVLNDPDLLTQLRLAHDLRNALVTVEHEHEAAMQQMWLTFPTVAAAQQQLTEAETTVAHLVARATDEHRQDRRPITRPGTAEAIRQARLRVTAARAARAAARNACHPAAKPAIANLKAERNAAIKALYAEHVQRRGLYAPTYSAVLVRHRATVARVHAARQRGTAAQLRPRTWDGTGTVYVQPKRATGWPVRSPAVFASGAGRWRNVLQIRPGDPAATDRWAQLSRAEQRQAGRGVVVWYLGGGRHLTLPVQMHRPLPTNADICAAQLTRSRVGNDYRLHVGITFRLPDPVPIPGPVLAVHFGWRQQPDGGLRAATFITTSAPLPPIPSHLVGIVHNHGSLGEVIVPARWRETAAQIADLNALRHHTLIPIRDHVADWLVDHPQPDPADPTIALTADHVRAWKPGRLAALTRHWRDHPPTGADTLVAAMAAWRRRDAHLAARFAHTHDQLRAHRTDTWRKVAAWLTERIGTLVVDTTDFRALRRRDDPTNQRLPPAVAGKIRHHASLAAPGTLRAAIVDAATRQGAAVARLDDPDLTRTHHRSAPHQPGCGHLAPPDRRYGQAAIVRCPACHARYDQDHNAVALLLHRYQHTRHHTPHSTRQPGRP